MGKPAFDPSQPFEVKSSTQMSGDVSPQSQKPAFDPSQPFEVPSEKASSPERPWYSVDPKNLGPGFLKGLENIDKYTAAPIRKFATEMVTGKKMDHAPTGSEQAKMLGASDTTYKESWGVPSYLGGDISPADIYGVGLEMVQDPFVLASGAKNLITKGAPNLIEKFGMKQSAKLSQEQAAKAASNATAKASATISGGDTAIEQSGQIFKYKAPESLDELAKWEPPTSAGQMPGKQRLEQIVEIVPDLQTKPMKYHFDMMDNPKSMKELKLIFENLPTENAKKIAQYNQRIVDESTDKIRKTVEEVVGNEPRSLSDAGNDFIGSVKEKYNAEKTALGPVFEEVKKHSPKLNATDSRDLIVALGENTKIGKVLSQDPETGRFFLKPNTPRTGLADDEFKVLSRVVDDLNDGMSFEEIQKTRDFLRKAIDPTNPAASAEIGKVRSIMLGHLEHMAEGINPDIGSAFKGYAINERGRESIEKIIGGKIESFDAMYAANPEKVVGKVLSNPNYAKIVRQYVGDEKMNEMIGSFIHNGIEKSTDSARGFSPEKFKSWLKRNDHILKENLEPSVLNRFQALSDYGYYGKRFLDEVNPSGTAASLQAMLEPGSFAQKVTQKGITGAVVGEVTSRANSAFKQRSAMKSLNEMLGSVQEPAKISPSNVAKNVEKTVDAIAATKKGVAVGNLLNREKENKEKGETKWANDGLKKLNDSAKSQNNKKLIDLLSSLDKNDQKTKRLLIEASDYKPGSVGFERVIRELKKLKEGQK